MLHASKEGNQKLFSLKISKIIVNLKTNFARNEKFTEIITLVPKSQYLSYFYKARHLS